MKYTIFVATLACILSAALAFSYGDHKIEQVQSEIMSYVAENMGSLRMMRSGNSLVCYDTFIPTINNIAEEAKNKSRLCVEDAENTKNSALADLTTGRAIIAAQVQIIQNDLNTCTEHTDNLEYAKCMLSIADPRKQTLDNIKSKAQELIQGYNSAVQGVDTNEQTCLNAAVDGAKIKSDAAFNSLKTCLGTPTASV